MAENVSKIQIRYWKGLYLLYLYILYLRYSPTLIKGYQWSLVDVDISASNLFSFTYGVNSGYKGAPAYGHHETRDGGTTSGSYYVHLPDGLKQKVEYTVDEKNGFKAKVSRISKLLYEYLNFFLPFSKTSSVFQPTLIIHEHDTHFHNHNTVLRTHVGIDDSRKKLVHLHFCSRLVHHVGHLRE